MSWCVLFLLLAAAEPAPSPTPTPVPAAPRRLGDVKLRESPGEAGKKVSSASGTAKPDSASLPEREEVPKTRSVVRVPQAPEHVDREGRGEAWWRERAARARREVHEAERMLADAERERAELLGGSAINGRVVPATMLVLAERRVAKARERLEKARGAEEGLREEARRADAWPGWLRE